MYTPKSDHNKELQTRTTHYGMCYMRTHRNTVAILKGFQLFRIDTYLPIYFEMNACIAKK